MAITDGTDLLTSLVEDTVIFQLDWALSIVFTLLTLLLINRDTQVWKRLAFPVMVGWHIAGVPPFILMYLVTAIMFVLEHVSLQTVSNIMGTRSKIRKGLGIDRGRKIANNITNKVAQQNINVQDNINQADKPSRRIR